MKPGNKYYIRKRVFVLCLFISSLLTIGAAPLKKPNVSNNTSAHSQASVIDYGAIGDGIHDDTNSFVSALQANKGGSLYIPSGTYIISSPLHIPEGITIFGDGDSSVIMAAPDYGIGKNLLYLFDSNNVSVKNIAVSGNIQYNTREAGYSAHDGIHLFDIWRSNNITITSCSFIDNVYAAIRLALDCSNISVDNCNFLNVDCGVIALGKGNVDSLTISNSLFDGHLSSEPVSLFGSGNYTNILISNNIIQNKTYGCAIICCNGPVQNITIVDNQIYNNCVGITLKNATDVKICRNVIDFYYSKDISRGRGLEIKYCSNVTICDNTISNTNMQGFYVKSCSNVKAYNNTIKNCGYSGKEYHAVDFRETCENVVFYNNTIIRSDDSLSTYSLVTHCIGSTRITNNTFVNSNILLESDSENVYLEGNNASIKNYSDLNIIN
nr:right-handed parallel beta-helix repeat-containing protein [uncultured Butyrivibrio sp.]